MWEKEGKEKIPQSKLKRMTGHVILYVYFPAFLVISICSEFEDAHGPL